MVRDTDVAKILPLSSIPALDRSILSAAPSELAGRYHLVLDSEPDQSRTPEPGDVTRLLSASASGDVAARDRLVELVYAEVHRMARGRMQGERPEHTLGATGLVHETFLKLFKHPAQGPRMIWSDRQAFFSAAATAMRRVLVDHARARDAEKRGGKARNARIEADALVAANSMSSAEFLSLDHAISRLEEVDARAAEVVRLRFYAGRDIKELAELLGVSDRTVKRDWEFARAWLFDHLGEQPMETGEI